MKKKIFIAVISLIVFYSAYYYWQNRYVELRPVIPAEENHTRKIIFFDNDLYKFAEPNEISPSYYKNIKWILDGSRVDYIEKNGIIYVRNKFLDDMNIVWNYTNRAISTEYFELEKKRDSTHLIYEKKCADLRRKKIESILKTIKTDSIKFHDDHKK